MLCKYEGDHQRRMKSLIKPSKFKTVSLVISSVNQYIVSVYFRFFAIGIIGGLTLKSKDISHHFVRCAYLYIKYSKRDV